MKRTMAKRPWPSPGRRAPMTSYSHRIDVRGVLAKQKEEQARGLLLLLSSVKVSHSPFQFAGTPKIEACATVATLPPGKAQMSTSVPLTQSVTVTCPGPTMLGVIDPDHSPPAGEVGLT